MNLIAELGWRSPAERWFVYVQQRYLSTQQEPNVTTTDSGSASAESNPSLAGRQISLDPTMDPTNSLTDALIAQVGESSTFGVLYTPLKSLYLGTELIWRGGASTPLTRLQVRYRW